MEIWLFRVRDYTDVLVGQYDYVKGEFYIKHGDGTRYSYSNDPELGRIVWSKKVGYVEI